MNGVESQADPNAPIGIFDSGIGGLTVAHAVKELMPNESIYYFGDTAHLPYGEKSAAAIQAYSIKITDIFIEAKCKLILIACNSASAAAFDLVKEYVGSRAHVENVIDPAVLYVSRTYGTGKVGLIGTRRTVYSKIYEKKIRKINKNIQLKSLATPLLVPMIEEGYYKDELSESIISTYLKDSQLRDVKALILGCTHYPLIKEQIRSYYHNKVDVIDSAEQVAKKVQATLQGYHLEKASGSPTYKFLVSDYTKSFETAAAMFFHKRVDLEEHRLWE